MVLWNTPQMFTIDIPTTVASDNKPLQVSLPAKEAAEALNNLAETLERKLGAASLGKRALDCLTGKGLFHLYSNISESKKEEIYLLASELLSKNNEAGNT